ncbi:MAG: type II secretion system protein [Planctomycetota bacterium]|jgi:prepilin-type N-terminal cleavage/methylation domain-containing protein
MQVGNARKRGFTLVELLVVISIISVIMAIALPTLGRVRRQARTMLSMSNQRQIVSGMNLFASNNNDRYPESVATIGFGNNWNWSDSTRLTGNRRRSPQLYRSMSEYLRRYIADASTMFCPNAPQKYQYLQQSWDAGDNWDNPNTAFPADPVGGSYCFYWNYRGFLGGRRVVFKGPQGPASSRRYSKLLVSDYFGYDHWRTPGSYGSCEQFNGAGITPETWLLSAYWSHKSAADIRNARPVIKLRAGYTDGHIETYSASEVVPMKVSITADGRVPYPDGVGPGIFFLPSNALH